VSKKTPHREPAPDIAGMAEPELRESRQALRATVFATIAERLERQRAALLSRDPGAIARSFEALVPLLGDLSMVVRTADGEGSTPGPLGDFVRRIRDEIRLNQTLISHGTAIADHFVLCVAHASPTISPALFSEVA
jgi:hypothetical protein